MVDLYKNHKDIFFPEGVAYTLTKTVFSEIYAPDTGGVTVRYYVYYYVQNIDNTNMASYAYVQADGRVAVGGSGGVTGFEEIIIRPVVVISKKALD